MAEEVGRLSVRITADTSDWHVKWNELIASIQKFGAEATAALNNINTNVEKVHTAITEKKRGLDEAGVKAKSLREALAEVADKFSFVGRVAAGIIVADIFFQTIRAIRGAIDAITNMESVLRRLAVISTDTGQEFALMYENLRTAAIEASIRFGVGIDEAARALEALVKAGLSGNDALKALSDALAAARLEGTNVETVTRNLVMVMAQFGIGADNSSRAMSGLLNMSRLGIGTMADFAGGLGNVGAQAHALGLTLEETGAYLVALERRFGNADEAGTALNRLLRDLYEIAIKLNIPITDMAGGLRNTTDILTDVVLKTGEYSGRLDLLQDKLVGVQERAIRALLYLSEAFRTKELERLLAEMSRGLTIQDMYIRSLGAIKDAQDRVNASTERFFALRLEGLWRNLTTNLLSFIVVADQGARTTENLVALMSLSLERIRETTDPRVIASNIGMVRDLWNMLRDVIKPEQIKGFTMFIDDWIETFRKMGREVPPVLLEIRNELNEMNKEAASADFGDRIEDQAMKTKHALETAIKIADDFLKAIRDMQGAFKDIFTLMEYGGAEGALLGFLKWVEAFRIFEERLDTLRKIVSETGGIIQGEVAKYAMAFGDFLASQVGKGKVAVDDAIGLIEDLASVVEGFPREEIIGKIIDAEKARQSREEAEKLAKYLDKLKDAAERGREKIIEWAMSFVNATENLGIFTSKLRQLDGILADLNSKGIRVELSKPLQDLRDFIKELNNISIELKIQNETYGLMSSSVGLLTTMYRTQGDVMEGMYGVSNKAIREYMRIVREKNGLTHEEYQHGLRLIEYLRREGVIRGSEVALLKQLLDLNMRVADMVKEEREAYDMRVDSVDELLRSRQSENRLTLEQEATMKRLSGIQSVLNTFTQMNTLAMQAMQFAMLGNTEAANKLTGFLRALAGATEDGYVDTTEYVDILKSLGVTFDEQGKPIFNFSDYLNKLAETIQNNTNKVNELIGAINNLKDKHVVIVVETVYRTRHETADGRTPSRPPDYQIGEDYLGGGGRTPSRPPDYQVGEYYSGGGGGGRVGGPLLLQRGAWFIPFTQPALLHGGEMVLPKEFADVVRERISGRRGGDIVVNVNLPSGGYWSGWFGKRREWEEYAKIIAYRIRETM